MCYGNYKDHNVSQYLPVDKCYITASSVFSLHIRSVHFTVCSRVIVELAADFV